jgi:hypothetical protein
MEEAMKKSTKLLAVAFASAFSTTALAQDAGQASDTGVAGAAAVPGQVVGGAAGGAGGPGGGPGTVPTTSLTFRSYPIAAGASAGNLEGAACTAPAKMLSGACHPFYNDKVAIINQFPDIPGNTWRCGFKNNTAASVTVWIYTLCGQ